MVSIKFNIIQYVNNRFAIIFKKRNYLKHILLLMIFFTFSFASLNHIYSFEADFTQNITDEKNKVLTYNGHLIASKPLYALWRYIKPVKKDIYINSYNVTIIEPEIEQVIVKRIESKFDFFSIVESAREIKKDVYQAFYRESKFTITSKNGFIESISYLDEFDNKVKILFTNQKQNMEIDNSTFVPKIPSEFDLIKD